MKIIIDADGCPVTKIASRIAIENNIECIIISDTSHIFDIKGVKTVTVSKGNDSVDFYLVNILEKGDIAVTQDYGLAAMCLAKGAIPISQNGVCYTDENILNMLNDRHYAKMARMSGKKMKGPSKRDRKYDVIFEDKLKELIKNSNNY